MPGDPGSCPLDLQATGASSLVFRFTGNSYPQTVPVTVLGPTACSQQHPAPGSTGSPILPGMVCTTVVGELPQCEVSSNPQPLPSRPLAISHLPTEPGCWPCFVT